METEIRGEERLATLRRQIRAEAAALPALRADADRLEFDLRGRPTIDPAYLAGMVLSLPAWAAVIALCKVVFP